MEEQIVLVDEAGKEIGTAPKLASHHDATPLHRGFSCYLFNTKGQFLLSQRALVKKVWPSVWTNSVCGHPMPNETNEQAVLRRLSFELGIREVSNLVCVDSNYRYTTPPYNGIIENEICPVFVAITNQQAIPNPLEVEAYRWIDWTDIDTLIAEQPDNLSYWFKDQYRTVFAHNGAFQAFRESING